MSEPMDKREALNEGFKWEKGASKEDVAILYADHQASLAANRGQKAEIERLTHRLIRANLAFVLSDAVLPTDFETELPPTKRLHAYISKLEAELASLRASAGEKPEDAHRRGQENMRDYMNNILCEAGNAQIYVSLIPYVAPPTLPTEK